MATDTNQSNKTFFYDLPDQKYAEDSKFVNADLSDFNYDNKRFLSGVKTFNAKDGDINVLESNITDATYTHSGLMTYLALAWAREFGIQIRPDVFHHAICCELATYIRDRPEKFRSLYTTSKEKVTLKIEEFPANTDDLIMRIDNLLNENVPHKDFKAQFTDLKFDCQPNNYEFVKRVAFSFSATPYYSYVITACGFPSISLVGSKDDWIKLAAAIYTLNTIIEENTKEYDAIQYLSRCADHIGDIISNYDNDDALRLKLRDIFYVNDNHYCGSGHTDYHINGWGKDFYIENKKDYVLDYQAHISYLPYKYDNKNFCILTGLLASESVDNVLVPGYGQITMQILSGELAQKLSNPEPQVGYYRPVPK